MGEDSDDGEKKAREIINDIEKGLMWRKSQGNAIEQIGEGLNVTIGLDNSKPRFSQMKSVVMKPTILHKFQVKESLRAKESSRHVRSQVGM